jgi:maltose O-acetyltransferase
MHVFITGNKITIGNNTIVNRGVLLDGRSGISIGNNVSISIDSKILSMTHDVQSPTFQPVRKHTIVEDYSWLGVGAVLLPGVRIRKGSVVGAGAIVTNDVNEFNIVAGNPAKKIGERNLNLNYTLIYRPFFDGDIC